MLTLDIDPIAFVIGPVAVPWYAVTLIAAVAVVVVVARREAGWLRFQPRSFYLAALWMIVAGLLGARVAHVVDWWDYYSAHPARILRLEGWALYGAILGAVFALWLYARASRSSFAGWSDVVAAGAPLGQAVGRIGCLIQGCCYGLPTSLPFAIVYAHPDSYAPRGETLHPAQLYFLLWNLIVFGALQRLKGRLTQEGDLFLAYLALYAAGDFALRFLRPGDPVVLGLQQAQIIGLVVLIAAVVILAGRTLTGNTERVSRPQG